MMNTRANAVVGKLCDELRSIEEQTLALIGVARFRRIEDAQGRIVASFDPTDAQRALAQANAKRLQGWTAAVAALIRRRAASPVSDFRAITDEFAECIAMTRTGNAVQLESRWREESSMVIAEYTAELMSIVTTLRAPDERPVDLREPFEVVIRRADKTRWRIESNVRGVQAVDLVTIPFTAEEVETFIRECCGPRASAAVGDLKPLETFGRVLFDAVFAGATSAAYAALRQSRLCMTIHAADADARIPWELLHDGSGFVNLNERIGFVRGTRATSGGSLALRTPLRILLTFSNASTRPWLDADRERQEIEDALAPLVHFGAVEIDVTPDGTLNTARRILRAGAECGRPYDLWHFTGHGGFDSSEGAALSMTTSAGTERIAYGTELRELLRQQPQLKLVVFNACEGGRADTTTTQGVVTAAMAGGVSALVAMQFRILDSAAIVFAAELYGALADGDSIDRAVTSARRAVFFTPNYTDWVAPVVFVADGGLKP